MICDPMCFYPFDRPWDWPFWRALFPALYSSSVTWPR